MLASIGVFVCIAFVQNQGRQGIIPAGIQSCELLREDADQGIQPRIPHLWLQQQLEESREHKSSDSHCYWS